MSDQQPASRRSPLGQGLGTVNEIVEGPVTDWATDFDHTDPRWVADPYPIWEELRGRCPVAHTDRYGGAWLPTTHEHVAEIAHDTERFSSRSILMGNVRPPLEIAPAGAIPPISSDPPYHHDARRRLLPAFSPQAATRLEPATRAYCEQLLDGLEGRDLVDGSTDFAQHIPVRVISQLLGFPPEDGDLFRSFIHNALEGLNNPREQRIAGFTELFDYLVVQIDDHLDHPRDDLTTYLIDSVTAAGEELSRVLGTIGLALIAGIDTTWSAIGASLWHLAGHPEDRHRLLAEPELLPTAIEEFLRAYSPVTMARLVKHDIDFHGVQMKADDWVLLSFPSANRDPAFFERADEVVIDRQANRHAAFGLGIHRCIGSHLARMELRVAIETFLQRFPEFSLADPGAVTWSAGQVRGPRTLPLAIGR